MSVDRLFELGRPLVGVDATNAGTTSDRVRRGSNARLLSLVGGEWLSVTFSEANSANDRVAPYRSQSIDLVHEMAIDEGDRLSLALEAYLHGRVTDETDALWVLFGSIPDFRIHLDHTGIVPEYYKSPEGSPERADALRRLSAVVLGALSTFDTHA